jgi:hypothetical protein
MSYSSQTGRPRIALTGRNLGEDSGVHTFLVIRVDDDAEFYPHGVGPGVRLNREDVARLVEFLREEA